MNERQLTLHAPALSGKQQLMVRRIEGREALSELFAYEVTLYSLSDGVDFAKVLGQEMCIGLEQPKGDPERFIHGYVSSFASVGSEDDFFVYRAELRPHLWRLTRSVNCRVFQGETVPDIIMSVLKAHGITGVVSHFARELLPWEYCVQYRETDFAFISRLMEREGIHYFFRHEKDKHVLYIDDTNPRDPAPGYADVKYERALNRKHPDEEAIWNWRQFKQVLSDRTTVTDFDFTKPGESLMRSSGSEVKREHDDARDYEVYDHLETTVQQSGYSAQLSEDYARIRSEELHTEYAVVSAETDARGLVAGACFKLKEGPSTTSNVEYLILSTHLLAEMDLRASGSSGEGGVYHASFRAIDVKSPFRPPRLTPKPTIPGPQSAIVTGPKGAKDAYTDQWGRVYVKFHWYRKLEDSDKDISCWVRVSQNSAGANWGSMFIPHVGQEVIVSFYEGDPDRPVVTGRVYNGSNKPPLTLPANSHKSIIRDHFGNEVLWDEDGLSIHSPSASTGLCIGKGGKRTFTEADEESLSYNSKSYSIGFSQSYTMGSSFSLSRGMNSSISLGTNLSAFVGAQVNLAVSTSLEFKAGLAMSFVQSASASFGFSRDFKSTKGDYTRMSADDVQLSSAKIVYIAGGGDHSVFRADKNEISMSYDPAFVSRTGDISKSDAFAKGCAMALAGASSALAGLGSWQYTKNPQSASVEKMNCNGEIRKSVDVDLSMFTGLVGGDASIASAALAGAVGVWKAKHSDIKPPEHPSPVAKIALGKDYVKIFAGKEKEAGLEMKKSSGLALTTQKKIELNADKEINLASKTTIKVEANNAVLFKGQLKHANWMVSK